VLFVSNVITDLHLLLDQVLRLHEGANELVPLFFLQITHLVLMDYIGNFELLFLRLKLVLLVNQLLSENSLLVVKVQEHAQIFSHLIVLFGFDDSFDLTLLRHLLFRLINFGHVILN
jgi:hypothetical protein